jgi:hypothetical protein
MMGGGDQLRKVLCSTTMKLIQGLLATSCAFSSIVLISAIVAVYLPVIGYAEKCISFSKFCLKKL